MPKKRCTKCKRFKPVSKFYKNRQAKDGLTTYCKACLKADATKRIVRNLSPIKDVRQEQGEKNKRASNFATKIGYLVQQTESPADYKGPGINTWEQADSAIREMAELQVVINKEVEDYNKRAEQNKTDVISVTKPFVTHQARLRYMLKMFVKSHCHNGEKIIKQLRFGTVTFHRGKMDVVLDTALAEKRAGKL